MNRRSLPLRLPIRSWILIATWFACLAGWDSVSALAAEIDFATEVRPILSDACFNCHGPDEETREADLRLDVAEEAAAVIEAGDWKASELMTRILSKDSERVMPPPDSETQLSADQIETLKRWIKTGAQYDQHWAFTAPQRPQIPSDLNQSWVRNPIDAFVARRLRENHLKPSPQASPETLIRRLSLDLTGLPPEPQYVKTWTDRLSRHGEVAYQNLVSDLLQSAHYGERWARIWLDAARYADSDGYEKDKPRNVWFYRDWVIDSFNRDRPYNDFIVRQIAGDLMPNATQQDHVATGFLRNSMVNEEGGADPEQFRMEAMFDRMDAIGKAILGLTIQCGQCHSHKYDPLKQSEYYGMFAFLNNTHDAIISVYGTGEQRRREKILQQITERENRLKQQIPNWKQRVRDWAKQAAQRPVPNWTPIELEFLDRTLGGSKFLSQGDASYLCQSYAPTNFNPQGSGLYNGQRLTGIRLELLTHPNLPRGGPGRSVDGTWALSELTAEVVLSDQPDKKIAVKFSRALADRSPDKAVLKSRYDNKKKIVRVTGGVDFAIDGDAKTAWTNEVDSPQSNIPQSAWFEFADPIDVPADQTATLIVNLAQRHGGWNSDDNQTFNLGRFRVSVTGDNIPSTNPLPIAVSTVLDKPQTQWTESDWSVVFSHWRTTVEEAGEINREIESLWKQHPRGTTQLALAERETKRATSLLSRGDFLSPLREVTPHVPEFLHPLEPSDSPPRLRFAQWLVDEDSPTAARSMVNRVWQAYFGVGLVETSDDLGTQGSPPSHPDLLDYLAVEFVENGWSFKELHRLIVSSATYRQSSRVLPELQRNDPYNRLMARGARFRVPAETVRDIGLAASGLLDRSVGGESVYPPAPAFLFQPPVSYGPKVWNVAQDSARYRRGLYTFRFRSVPYPMLENFDAVPGNLSCVRRSNSNTPMQALTSLNEPMFLECSIALAAKVLRERPGKSERSRLEYAVWRCLQRAPTEKELGVLLEYHGEQVRRLESKELSADEILSSGKLLDLSDLDTQQLAAWSLACRVILNLDETITRE